MSDKPLLTIEDVAFRCGVAYNTVKRTVMGNPKITREGKYPTVLTLAKPDSLNDMIRFDYSEKQQPEQGWAAWLEEVRGLLPSIVAMPDTLTGAERQRKIRMFTTLGTSFLSLAKYLEENDG